MFIECFLQAELDALVAEHGRVCSREGGANELNGNLQRDLDAARATAGHAADQVIALYHYLSCVYVSVYVYTPQGIRIICLKVS
jgi:hypothetical protein